MMANHTGVVALVLLVVVSMASMVVAHSVTTPAPVVTTTADEPKNNVKLNEPTLTMGRVSFKRIADIKTNGLKIFIKRKLDNTVTPPREKASAVPSLDTIANIITFIRKSIDQKKTKEQKKFYIGQSSYYPDTISEVETLQIKALSARHDDVKVNLHRKLEMVLLYDTVIDPKIPKHPLKLDTHVRSHSTLEALLLHIFCDKPPKDCKRKTSETKTSEKKTRSEDESCPYFPEGSHKELNSLIEESGKEKKKLVKKSTTLGDILSKVADYNKLDHYTQYNDLCNNTKKGTINGATRSKSNTRGILYFAGFDNDA